MEKISFKKAVLNDRFLFSSLLLTTIFLIIAFIFGVNEGFIFSAENFGFLIIGVWLVLSVLFLLIRVIQLLKFKSDRRPYLAEVIKVFTYRGAKRITYTYKVDHVEYKSGNFVMVNKYSKQIHKGDQVEINISETHPKTAFIRDIYFDIKV